ncbi:MAG: response regulator [Bdellovibrionales bacterium]|nr:response regulator [Bdellovibrionales bacterium]
MSKPAAPPPDRIDILLVDDRPENLLALEAVLAAPGYHLIKANSGDEALRYLLDHDPALILMDVQMPELDGYETASLIKNSRRTREIPIIFVTALNLDEQYVHKAYDHGAVDYVYKPFDAHILRSKVAVFADLARKTKRLVQTEILLRDAERKERERQIAELELKNLKRERAEQRKYRDLVEGIDHGVVWSIGAETQITTFVGPNSEKILGFPREAWNAEANFFLNHLHPDDRETFRAGLERTAVNRRGMEFDHRFLLANGGTLWLHTAIRRAKAVESDRPEIRALSVDITQLKLAEAALIRNKARSDFLAAASALLAESLDTEKTLAHFSRLAIGRVADFQSVDVLEDGATVRTVSLDASDEGLARELRGTGFRFPVSDVLRTGRSRFVPAVTEAMLDEWFVDGGARRQVGELHPLSLIVTPIPVRGRFVGTLTFVATSVPYEEADLTMAEDLGRRAGTALENAALYVQTQEAVRARDEFLSIASHELKTPLTPLKLQTQSLRRALNLGAIETPGGEKIIRMLDSSDRQIARISRLIDDLLDISRINSGKMQLTFEEFLLSDLLRDTVDRFAEEIKIARCTVTLECDSDIRVQWDRFRIEQVVVNLLTNAIKYGAGSGIEIRAQESEGVVIFSVRDHGIGIAEADQARVFGRFERAVSGSHFGGLGLGLYIVTQILEAHGGSISLKSRTGMGSTFTVRLATRFSSEDRTGSAYASPLANRKPTTSAVATDAPLAAAGKH